MTWNTPRHQSSLSLRAMKIQARHGWMAGCTTFHVNTDLPTCHFTHRLNTALILLLLTAVLWSEGCDVSQCWYTPMAAVIHMMMSRTTHHRMSVFRRLSSWLRLYLGPLLFIMALVSWPESHSKRKKQPIATTMISMFSLLGDHKDPLYFIVSSQS